MQILAVCDVDTTRRENAKQTITEKYDKLERKNYGGIATFIDFRELIARKDIDAVCIATPDHWHTIPIIEACKAGKDIYCEKPLTLTIHEAKYCIDAVRKFNRVFQTGSQQRSSKEFRQAVNYVRSGRIGTIKQVLVDVGGPSKFCDLKEEPMEPGLEWERWLGQAPLRPYNSILSPRGIHNEFPRLGATTANTLGMAQNDRLGAAPPLPISPSGALAWTNPAPSKSSRPKTPRPRRASATSTPAAASK